MANRAGNPPTHLRGWLDTRERVLETLKADEFLTALVTRNLNVDTFTIESTANIINATMVMCHARYLAHGRPLPKSEYIQALAMGELMAPVLPESLFLPEARAREMDLIMQYLLTHDTLLTRGKTPAGWIAEIVAANEEAETEEQRIQVPIVQYITMEQQIDYLLWLGAKMVKGAMMTPLTLMVTNYVAAAKRGSTSEVSYQI